MARPSTGPIMLVSNPNAGKTTLFNQITGLRHKTSNYPGTTLDLRSGPIEVNESGAWHSGHAFGFGIENPVRWHTSRPE